MEKATNADLILCNSIIINIFLAVNPVFTTDEEMTSGEDEVFTYGYATKELI